MLGLKHFLSFAPITYLIQSRFEYNLIVLLHLIGIIIISSILSISQTFSIGSENVGANIIKKSLKDAVYLLHCMWLVYSSYHNYHLVAM